MTNAEKFLKDGVDIGQLAREITELSWLNDDCLEDNITMYFRQQAKPTLTEDERVILRNVKWKGYSATHIGRARENKGSFIYLRFENDIETTYFFDNFFGHLFQFIKERRRIRDKGVIR